jgi:hypothetical protein
VTVVLLARVKKIFADYRTISTEFYDEPQQPAKIEASQPDEKIFEIQVEFDLHKVMQDTLQGKPTKAMRVVRAIE